MTFNTFGFLFLSSCLLWQSTVAIMASCNDPLGPLALNNCQFFQVSTSAELSCNSKASRCGFSNSDFSLDAVANGGSLNVQGTGTVWIASQDGGTEELELGICKSGSCVVDCYADCSCTDLSTGLACETTTAPPTPAPQNEPKPTPYICPEQLGTEHCPDLMRQLPTTDPGCDCYNFCQGVFLSCCNKLSNKCGATECVVADGIAQGLPESNVLGCTKELHLNQQQGGGNTSAGVAPFSLSLWTMARTMVLGLGVVMGWVL